MPGSAQSLSALGPSAAIWLHNRLEARDCFQGRLNLIPRLGIRMLPNQWWNQESAGPRIVDPPIGRLADDPG